MAGLNIKNMRKNYQDNQRGGDIWKPPVGLTMIYLHPPCRGEDDKWEPTTGTNLIAVGVHYDLDAKHSMSVCLDLERNPILGHPFLKKFLKLKKVEVGNPCPVERAIASGKIDAEAANNSRLNTRYLFGITPIAHKAKRSDETWQKLPPIPGVMLVGSNVYNGIMDEIFENGDITDPNAAIFLVIAREGTKKNDTKYTVKADAATVKKPRVLPEALQARLTKALSVGGDCDLFKIVANMTKSHEEVQACLSGSKVKTGRGSSEDEDDDLPEPDDLDDVDLDEDEDEKPAPKAKAKKPKAPEPDEDEEELVDEDEDEEPAPAKKAAKKAKEPEPEEDDEDELVDDDEDEEPAPPPKKTKLAAAPAAKKPKAPEPEEDDDDELVDDDEDEEPAPPPKAKKSKVAEEPPAKVKKVKAPAPEPDEDDEELADDDEEEAPPPKAKKTKTAPAPAEDDDDDDLGLDELDAELAEATKASATKKGPGRPKKS